mmetsp:Transcript_2415/g.5051  ORF Transcript_2415/g.5051 Transcript_2415/m.5051 type:complete len:168 (-) Transcript_2415:194-697(-)
MLRSIPRLALRLQPSCARAATGAAARSPLFLAQSRAFGASSVNSYRFAKSHEWAKLDGDIATIGISVHAQKELGDIVFVELPEKGDTLEAGKTLAAVESVKAAADVYTPVAGEIVDVNAALTEDPAIVNKSAETDGWIAKIRVSNKAEYEALMDRATYDKYLEETAH